MHGKRIVSSLCLYPTRGKDSCWIVTDAPALALKVGQDHLPSRCQDSGLDSQARPAVTLHSNAGKCALGSRYCTQFPEFAELFILKSRTESDARKKDSVIFVLISRTNFSLNFVRGLSAKFRGFSATTMHSNPGKGLKTKKRDSGN
jgi:hypothetical protein